MRTPTPARRARTLFVIALTAAMLGLFAVVSTAASSATASSASYLGSVALSPIRRPVTGMTSTPSGRGYWLVADDGGVFSFGDARFHGSTGGIRLYRPVVDMAASASGNGYWLVASDGGIFSFGDAHFYGSTGHIRLFRPIVGMARTPSGHGYWLVASDGGIFSFGDAHFYGSTGGRALSSPIVGIDRAPRGGGYWLVAHNGATFGFGSAHAAVGSGSSMLSPTVATASSPGGGYWMGTEDGGVYTATASGQWILDPHDGGTPAQRISKELYYRANEERRARGLNPLTWDSQLSSLATSWSTTMAGTGSFSHRNLSALFGVPTYADRYRTLEENIYEGNGSFGTAGSAHVALMNSPPHRAALLNPGLNSLGVGAYCGSGTLYVTEDFGTWVGRPAPPAGAIPPLQPFVRDDYLGVHC